MSAPRANGAGGDATARRVVASYTTYRDAERAVDHLADNKFPVEHVAIVGRDLALVEQVTGRFGWGDAILRGALSGALVGALVGWLLFAFDWVTPIVARGWLIVDGLWVGTLAGIAFGLIVHAVTGGRRDFTSVPTMAAAHYDVLVDEELAAEAERLLATMGPSAAPAAPAAPAPSGSETSAAGR
jgi:hypothetical protein